METTIAKTIFIAITTMLPGCLYNNGLIMLGSSATLGTNLVNCSTASGVPTLRITHRSAGCHRGDGTTITDGLVFVEDKLQKKCSEGKVTVLGCIYKSTFVQIGLTKTLGDDTVKCFRSGNTVNIAVTILSCIYEGIEIEIGTTRIIGSYNISCQAEGDIVVFQRLKVVTTIKYQCLKKDGITRVESGDTYVEDNVRKQCVNGRVTYLDGKYTIIYPKDSRKDRPCQTSPVGNMAKASDALVSVTIPLSMELIHSIKNKKNTKQPATKYEYITGLATKVDDRYSGLKERQKWQYRTYGEMCAKLGITSVSKITANVGHIPTQDNLNYTAIRSTADQMVKNEQVSIGLGSIPNNKAKYVYQIVGTSPGFVLNFQAVVFNKRLTMDTDTTAELIGVNMLADPSNKFEIISLYDRNKVLSFYEGHRLYLGDSHALSDPDHQTTIEWRFIRSNQVQDVAVYWIKHVNTGKLVTFSKGGKSVNVVDPGVMKEPLEAGKDSLWKVEPSGEVPDAYYIAHYDTGKVLSWYRKGNNIPYGGDAWVKEAGGPAKSQYGSVWNIFQQ